MFDFNSMHASISKLRQKQIFFVGGPVKSGTTWLQLLLDAHPSVSCSGEGHFSTHLWGLLKEALDKHDSVIKTNNEELFTELEEYKRLTQDDFGTFLQLASQFFWSNRVIINLRARSETRLLPTFALLADSQHSFREQSSSKLSATAATVPYPDGSIICETLPGPH
jgi:hypothetical protein